MSESEVIDKMKEAGLEEIDTAIRSEAGFKMAAYCQANNIKVSEFRAKLIEIYGDTIEFRRGRYGGVFLRDSSNS